MPSPSPLDADSALPRTSKGKRTRQLILDAARKVLNRYGYRLARISDIIDETGLPTGSFYRYFDGKVDVTLQVLRLLAQDYSEHVPSSPSTTLFEREFIVQQRLIALFDLNRGVINGYFSAGEKEEALVRFFHEQTHRFVEANFAFVQKYGGFQQLAKKDFYPIAGALIGMSENLVYRLFSRNREPQPAQQDVAMTLATLRYRAITGTDPRHSLPSVFASLHGPRKRPLSRPLAGEPVARSRSAGDSERVVHGPIGLRVDSKATLAQIERTTLKLLDRHGYEDLRLSDIEESSGVTRGAIYHHYEDKDALIRKVLLDRLAEIDQTLSRTAHNTLDESLDAFDKLLLFTRAIVGSFADTPGVLKVLNQLEDRDVDVLAAYDACWGHWIDILSELLFRHASGRLKTPKELWLLSDAFLSMAERLLRDLYLAPSGRLKSSIRSREAAAVLLASLWYRMAFRSEPPSIATAHFPFFGISRASSGN